MGFTNNKNTGRVLTIMLALILTITFMPASVSAASYLRAPSTVYTCVASGRITVKWTGVSGATKYQLRGADTNTGRWKTLIYTSRTSARISVPNTHVWKFQVRSYRNGRYSSWSKLVYAAKTDKIIISGDKRLTTSRTATFSASLPSYYPNQTFKWYVNGELISDGYSASVTHTFDGGASTLVACASNGMKSRCGVTVMISGGMDPNTGGSTETVTPDPKYDASVRQQVMVSGQSVYIGEPESDVTSAFGNNYVNKASGADYTWHIYNAESNQGQMLFVGIKDSKVQAVYTNAIGWSYTDSVYSLYDGYVGTYDWYMTDKRNNSGVYITLYGDKYNSNKAYGIKIEKTVSGYSSYQAYTSAKKLDLLGMSASEQQTTLDDYADAEIYLINAMRTRANNMNYINISNRNMLVKDSFCMNHSIEWAGTLAAADSSISHSHGHDYLENVEYRTAEIFDPFDSMNQFYNEVGSATTGHRNNILLQNETPGTDYPTKVGCAFKISVSGNMYAVETFQ